LLFWWNLILAFEWLGHRPVVDKLLVQRLLGHVMTAMVLNRAGMSALRHLYDFAEAAEKPMKLWKSAALESKIVAGLLPLLVADMSLEWDSTMTCSDASPEGYGICETEMCTNQVRDIGAWQERWRYKRSAPDDWKPRQRFARLSPLSSVLTACKAEVIGEQADNYVVNHDFPEVPLHVLDPDLWKTVKFGKWHFKDEHITLKEGRTVVLACRRLSRAKHHRSKRHVLLVDNLALAFAIAKGRYMLCAINLP
jgi:hypothetical protein